MKNVRTVRKRGITYLGFLGMSLFVIHSCGNDNSNDTNEIAEKQNEERFDDRKSEKDAEFLVNAAAINLEEIKLGNLAQKKGSTDHVKALGKMMADTHYAAQEDLKALAANKSITIPVVLTEEGLDAYDDLKETGAGKDFDQQYADMMVKGHKAAIRKFEHASSNAKDPEIRNWASSMLPTLRTHLEHAEECKEACQAMK